MANNKKFKKIANFLFEIRSLKNLPRSGWTKASIEKPDSVAEHSFLVAVIAYFLAILEKANPERAVLISLIHDFGEARVGDQNMESKIYFKETEKAEKKAFFDQIKNLIGEKELEKIYDQFGKTIEGKIAKDADKLEEIIQMKYYQDAGEVDKKEAKLWIDYWKIKLRTRSAKKLARVIEKTKSTQWWKEIPEIKREIKKLKKK
jgi:putative hydrolase of HD superfamily